ncbi:MAG: glucohydrolase [Tenericutes bacterium GWC2_34_14]|nr:MAG: glucohydrolase [Tenericutes bacterium GWC2_34_14]OHE32985.1 MAG: glucohydrolase [Tenericutes bacterium GWE2_34_108]OHE36049.1 MAG: glucohydrolase [Tenericutes bacterium GWF1_35_14]OHE39272.1 MAG: glucohydrolase [Tenericutes bacterium GWF2_35_184]OHE44547.1 MAG: glucohydrolase [Tenericutes bacterium RIFOXYA2_FULL_36_32]OHE46962.1 MAG: glucohydrolase [Tenericutes bacterium RIFOXYA12_FULL_35_10]OHE47949.1 MAG: glucohydrolase [Tenericutes bacterium RIFOXYB2_FULL_36_25]OHE48773.1 MAG: glu
MEFKPSWKDKVVYQIYPRSFMDSNGDGVGDLKGIISKLDYVKSLGVDVIWLSPVYASPNDDNGYDISDYKAIQPEFGTMDDMDQLIKEANQRGLKIIMDLVINHTSDEHPWFIASKDKSSPYRDYYIWQDKPNNWTSFFGGKAWDKIGDSYYLHLFSKKQPDLNWNNPKVLEEIQDIIRFWLNKGIYGFRCDVINIIYKTSLEDGKKRLILVGREHYHSQEGMHHILKTLRKTVLDHYDTMTVGETVLVNTKQANDLILPEHKELDMVFGFEHMETDQINNKWFRTKFRPKKFIKVLVKWEKEVYWNANYLENHDQQRSVSRFGDDQKYHKESAKMLALLNLTLKGTPYIYQGEEIGMTNGDFTSLEEFRDVETHRIIDLAKKLHFPNWFQQRMLKLSSRDHARTPMQWTNQGGFTEGMPWIKVNSNTKTINVNQALSDQSSILHFYKDLISLRKTYASLRYGDFEVMYAKRGLFMFRRKDKEDTFVTMINMTKKTLKLPLHVDGHIMMKNYDNLNTYLKPYECRLIKENAHDSK